jgi:hypothetical protein
VDGRVAFTRYSRNRWTAFGSPHAEDWLEVQLARPAAVSRVELYLFADGRGVAEPASFRLEAWVNGRWITVPERSRIPREPTAWALNSVQLEPTTTSRVRVVFVHDGSDRSGLTELRIFE